MGKAEYATFPSGCTATVKSEGRNLCQQLPATPYPLAAVSLYELPVKMKSVNDAVQSLVIYHYSKESPTVGSGWK